MTDLSIGDIFIMMTLSSINATYNLSTQSRQDGKLSFMKKDDNLLSARLKFAKNIREARMRLGFSQEEMADKCGLHRTYVGSVERGERNISIDNMEQMANAVHERLATLLD